MRKRAPIYRKAKLRKVVFLDRDGVINRFPGRTKYVTSRRSFKFIPGSLQALRKLTEAGFILFVISNQAGVATLKQITEKMLKQVRKSGGRIKKVLYCMHLPEDNCACRKPKTAMIDAALRSLDRRIERKSSYLIGDDIVRDIPMGKRARLKTILVLSGRDCLEQKPHRKQQPDYVFKNLLAATHFILEENV